MGEIPGADHGNALAQGPPGKVLDIAVFAACARVPGVDVQVGVEHAVAFLGGLGTPEAGRLGSRAAHPAADLAGASGGPGIQARSDPATRRSPPTPGFLEANPPGRARGGPAGADQRHGRTSDAV